MTPGDEHAPQWLKDAEAIERKPESERLAADKLELANAKARAQLMQHQPESEVAAAYLAYQEARSALEREAAFCAALRKALSVLEPIALAALQAALTKGLSSLEVPAQLAPVVKVVESAAMEAAESALRDLKP